MSEFSDALRDRLARLTALSARFAAATALINAAAAGGGSTLTSPGFDFRSGTARDTVSDSEPPPETQDQVPPVLTWKCESLTGTALLCGFSGYDDGSYDPMSPEAWTGQYRKWKIRSLDVSHSYAETLTAHTEADCSGGVLFTENRFLSLNGTPAFSQTCDGCATNGTLTKDSWSSGSSEFAPTCGFNLKDVLFTYAGVDFPADVPTVYGYGSSGTVAAGSYTKSLTTEKVSISGTDTGCTTDGITSDLTVENESTGTLSEEQYLYEALLALLNDGGDIEVSNSCCASVTDANVLNPESISAHAITGTAVRIPIIVFGITGVLYSVNIHLTQGTSDFTESIGVRGNIPYYYYVPLPAPGDDALCVTDVTLP